MKRHRHSHCTAASTLGLIFTIVAILIGLTILAREWQRAHPNHAERKVERRHHAKHTASTP
jgi:hypothetical protein